LETLDLENQQKTFNSFASQLRWQINALDLSSIYKMTILP